jgi:hypothetical protein
MKERSTLQKREGMIIGDQSRRAEFEIQDKSSSVTFVGSAEPLSELIRRNKAALV